MPFFMIKSPRFAQPQPMPLAQVEVACRQRALEDLLSLKGRVFNFLKTEDVRRGKLKTSIAGIDVQVAGLEIKIKENKESIARAISYNNEVREGLPGNGAERWLALQALAHIPDTKYELDVEVEKLKKLKEQFAKELAWINKEFAACVAELEIIEQVIDEKRPKEMETPSADAMRM